MFRAIILPIFSSTRLCVTACGIMHPRCCRPATSWVHYTTCCKIQSNAPKDGRNHRPKHVELIGIINKPFLLHLVGVYIICINDTRSNKYQILRILSFLLQFAVRYTLPTCNLSLCTDIPRLWHSCAISISISDTRSKCLLHTFHRYGRHNSRTALTL